MRRHWSTFDPSALYGRARNRSRCVRPGEIVLHVNGEEGCPRRDTAGRNTIDDAALADELAALDQALDDEADEEAKQTASEPPGGRQSGGGAGPGSLDELTVLPHGARAI